MKTRSVVINLERRSDRRRDMEKQLNRIGWSAEFFPAIDPKEPDGFDSKGTRGCFLSHLTVLKMAVAMNVECLIIIEDDVNFSHDFKDGWDSVLAFTKSNSWSILYLGHLLKSQQREMIKIPHTTGMACAHFMMFSGDVIGQIVNGLEEILSRPAGHPDGGPMHIDGAYSTLRKKNPDIKTFAYCPSLAFQRPSKRDIGEPKWFDELPVIRESVGMARRVKAHAVTLSFRLNKRF